MIIDYLMQFTSDAGQALTAAAASDFRIDFGQEAPTTGLDHDRIVAVFTVKEDVTGTLTFSLQDCDTETGSYVDCVTAATLENPVAGTQIALPLPNHHKRYMQAYFGGAPTAGKVHAFITTGFQDNVPFKQAQSVEDVMAVQPGAGA